MGWSSIESRICTPGGREPWWDCELEGLSSSVKKSMSTPSFAGKAINLM